MVARAPAGSGRQQMLDHELQAALALVVVGTQPVNQPDPALRQCRRSLRVDAVEGNGLVAAAPFPGRDLEAQMPLRQDPRAAAQLEYAVEQRPGEAGAPGAARPERFGHRPPDPPPPGVAGPL